MTRLCLSLTEKSLARDLLVLKRHRDYCDLAELRCDCLDPEEYDRIASFPPQTDLPVVLTCRRTGDGGCFAGEEKQRLSLLAGALAGGFAFLELESDVRGSGIEERAADTGARIIRSLYDFAGIPGGLSDAMRVWAESGEMPKAMVTPGGSEGLESLLRIYGELADLDEFILLGVGDAGFPSRVLAGKLGSYLAFCPDPGGQAGPEDMAELYAVRETGRDTRVFGIIGNPVMHSRSPLIHNTAFRNLGMNAVYVPFETDDPEAFFRIAGLIDIRGFSVTMPFKKDIIPRLDAVSEGVSAVESCNTVVREGDEWRGYNTDVDGFIASILPFFPEGLRGVPAAVIGAGGAAGAVLCGLVSGGADVTVFNRTEERARNLARRYNCQSGCLADFEGSRNFRLVVQATGAGMHPQENQDPVPGYRFSGNEVVCDIIYAPEETVFLKRAREAGCRAVNGLPMLKAQGELQFFHFTGRRYPAGL